jgi:hypothetical protein
MDLGVAPTHRRAVDEPLGSKTSGAIRTSVVDVDDGPIAEGDDVTSGRADDASAVGCWSIPMA